MFMQTIVVRERRRHAATGLTERKRAELAEVARRWQAARWRYLCEYWDPANAGSVLRSIRTLANAHARKGWAETGLPDHQARLALESALALIKSNWATTFARVRDLIRRNERLSPSQKHWLRYVLRSPDRADECLRGRTVFVEKRWAEGFDEYDLTRFLRRMLLRYRAGRPRRTRRLWFQIDTNLYRAIDRSESDKGYTRDRHFRGAWIALSGLTRFKRLMIPLAGPGLTEFRARTQKANSRPALIVEVGDRIVFRIPERRVVQMRNRVGEAGLDKGYRTLLTVTTGEPTEVRTFGDRASAFIAEIAESSLVRTKERRRLMSYERSLRNTLRAAELRKAQRIRRNNLHDKKSARRARAEKTAPP